MEALTDVLPEDLDFNLKCFLSKWGSSNISLIRLSRSSSFSNVSANLKKQTTTKEKNKKTFEA